MNGPFQTLFSEYTHYPYFFSFVLGEQHAARRAVLLFIPVALRPCEKTGPAYLPTLFFLQVVCVLNRFVAVQSSTRITSVHVICRAHSDGIFLFVFSFYFPQDLVAPEVLFEALFTPEEVFAFDCVDFACVLLTLLALDCVPVVFACADFACVLLTLLALDCALVVFAFDCVLLIAFALEFSLFLTLFSPYILFFSNGKCIST